MSKFVVQMVDARTRKILETFDEEIFETIEEAEESAIEWSSNFSEGADVLELAGRDYIPAEDVKFIAKKLKD